MNLLSVIMKWLSVTESDYISAAELISIMIALQAIYTFIKISLQQRQLISDE